MVSCNKIPNGDVLVPAYPGCPGKRRLNDCRRQRQKTSLNVSQTERFAQRRRVRLGHAADHDVDGGWAMMLLMLAWRR